jgi:hypothetical protein
MYAAVVAFAILSEKQLTVRNFFEHVDMAGTGEIVHKTKIQRPTVKFVSLD